MAATYIIIWLACSLGLCLFGFWVGRTARRLPIIDSRLPWTLSRDQVKSACEKQQHTGEQPYSKPRWPDNPQ